MNYFHNVSDILGLFAGIGGIATIGFCFWVIGWY